MPAFASAHQAQQMWMCCANLSQYLHPPVSKTLLDGAFSRKGARVFASKPSFPLKEGSITGHSQLFPTDDRSLAPKEERNKNEPV